MLAPSLAALVAFTIFTSPASADGKSSVDYSILGQDALSPGEYDQAIDYFNEAIRRNPNDVGADYSVWRTTRLSTDALEHGKKQVRKMLAERPNMKEHVTEGDALFRWATRKFAGEDTGSLIEWDARLPENRPCCHIGLNGARLGQIRINPAYQSNINAGRGHVATADEKRPFEGLWSYFVVEVNRIKQAQVYRQLRADMEAGKISVRRFSGDYVQADMKAIQETRAFYVNGFLPWAKQRGFASDPWYWYTDPRFWELSDQMPQAALEERSGGPSISGSMMAFHRHRAKHFDVCLQGRRRRSRQGPQPNDSQHARDDTRHRSGEYERLLAQLKDLDNYERGTEQQENRKLRERVRLMERLVETCPDKHSRSEWLRRCVDDLSIYTNMGIVTDGVRRMRELQRKSRDWAEQEDRAHVEYAVISTEFGCKTRAPDVTLKTLLDEHVHALRRFVATYPKSASTAEVLFQLAGTSEVAGVPREAIKWYSRLRRDFPTHHRSMMAAGAIWRLTSTGKTMDLKKGEFKEKVDLSKLHNHIVLVVFWSTNTLSQEDVARLAKMCMESHTQPVQIVGVNLHSSPAELNVWLEENSWRWPLVRQPEGSGSPLAVRYGIMELPSMFLVNSEDRVIWHGVGVANCEKFLERTASDKSMGE